MKEAKYALVSALKSNAGVAAVLGDRIFPRRLDDQATLPALVVSKAGERREYGQNGFCELVKTIIQIDVFAKTDFQMEEAKQVIIAEFDGFRGELVTDFFVRSIFFDDSIDGSGSDLAGFALDLEEFRGLLTLEICWEPN